MEADEYFTTYDALHDKKESTVRRQLSLPINECCGIMKIIWSQFDFMTGPEMKFLWEVTPSTNLSPANMSGEDCSVADAESLIDSNASNQSVNFEDIDDPLKTELTIFGGLDDSFLDSSFSNFNMESGDCHLKYLDEYMTESRTTCTTTSTKTLTNDDSRFFDSPDSSAKSLRDEGFDVACGLDPAPSYLNASSPCVATSPFMESADLQRLLAERYPEDERSFGCLRDEDRMFKDLCTDEIPNDDALKRSCVDSGVGVSTHSDLSALCRTPPAELEGRTTSNSIESATSNAFTRLENGRLRKCNDEKKRPSLLDGFFDFSETFLTDEQFVTKCVLAEQICSSSSPHSRCPVQHKLMISRARHLIISSYIFSAQMRDSNTITYAVSFLMPQERQHWYMERQQWFERIICDTVPKLKASLFAEDADDVLVRATSELTRVMSLLSALERFALVSVDRPLMVKNSLFTEKGTSLTENRLLARAISGCLQSQGHCVLIGSDPALLSRLMYTLAFFVPEDFQWCCLRPYRHKYNPYVRLQVVRRSELPTLVLNGTGSGWPICVIDIDRSAVCMSAPYNRHRLLRAKNDSRGVRLILEHAGVMSSSSAKSSKAPQLELSTCRVLECVSTFLKRMDQLPMEESVRRGFCAQLSLYVNNVAEAFITYVRDSSAPRDDEKECGTRSKRFSLSECRKALDLTQDAWFNAVLARADLLKPEIAEFVYMRQRESPDVIPPRMGSSVADSLPLPSGASVKKAPASKTLLYAVTAVVVALVLLVLFVNLLGRGDVEAEETFKNETQPFTNDESAESSEEEETETSTTIRTSTSSSSQLPTALPPIVFPPATLDNVTTIPRSSTTSRESTSPSSESSTKTPETTSFPTTDHTHVPPSSSTSSSSSSSEEDVVGECDPQCRIHVVETVPKFVKFGHFIHTLDTFRAWNQALSSARQEIDVFAFKMNLRGVDVHIDADNSTAKGKLIYESLVKKAGEGVKIKVIDCDPPLLPENNRDSLELQRHGLIERRGLEMNVINDGGGGVQHSKMFVVDRRHLYVGSSNFEWRTFTEKLEVGLMFDNCSCVAEEAAELFENVWDFMGGSGKLAKISFQSHRIGDAVVQLLASPPMYLSSLSSWDLPRLLNVIYNAESFVDIAVMHYFPSWIYFKDQEFFPQIDNAIRMSLSRGVAIRILVSADSDEFPQLMFTYLRSLEVLHNVADNRIIEIKCMRIRDGAPEFKQRRMHSKFIVTDTTTFIGSSNYVPEYFYRSSGTAVAVVEKSGRGKVNRAVRAIFERYWRSDYAKPLGSVAHGDPLPPFPLLPPLPILF
ncbi:unnamed protein product [Caenorhabditis auriculariae]|uniref:PLD phosphodiesterase domain-containing protein n=1 Tax=Caenorhabditis auriculariae TaxID=2777116 RepID=A0A8S1H983_9PELO|nr:unnamed protein product [Caenorhabditis auriculariae]